MLPGLRTLLIATLTAIVVAFALLSQLHSHLPQGGNARARAAPMRTADANHMPLLVSQAAARRHEELHRLMSIASDSERHAIAIDRDPIVVAGTVSAVADVGADPGENARGGVPLHVAALPPESAPVIAVPRAAEPIAIPREEIVAVELGASVGEAVAVAAELSIGPLVSLVMPEAELVEPAEAAPTIASVLAVMPAASEPMAPSAVPAPAARAPRPRATPKSAKIPPVNKQKAAQQAAAQQSAKVAALAALATKKRQAALAALAAKKRQAALAAKKKSAARGARATRAPAATIEQNNFFPFSF